MEAVCEIILSRTERTNICFQKDTKYENKMVQSETIRDRNTQKKNTERIVITNCT